MRNWNFREWGKYGSWRAVNSSRLSWSKISPNFSVWSKSTGPYHVIFRSTKQKFRTHDTPYFTQNHKCWEDACLKLVLVRISNLCSKRLLLFFPVNTYNWNEWWYFVLLKKRAHKAYCCCRIGWKIKMHIRHNRVIFYTYLYDSFAAVIRNNF